jgi:hypothetical protein
LGQFGPEHLRRVPRRGARSFRVHVEKASSVLLTEGAPLEASVTP